MQIATTRFARLVAALACTAFALLGCQAAGPEIGDPYSADVVPLPDDAQLVEQESEFGRASYGLALCGACTTNADCGGAANYCLRRSDGVRFCGQDCRNASCPSGYSCYRLSSAVSQCVPPNAQCQVAPSDAGPPPPVDAGSPRADAGPPSGVGDVPNTTHCAAVANWDPIWRQWEEEVLLRTNQFRAAGASCGTTTYPPAGALAMNGALRCAARLHSRDMSMSNYFSHTSLDGRSVGDRVTATGYGWRTVGENIARGYRSPQSVVEGWMTSVGHCQNIMRSSYREIGVGYYTGDYWTQNFGASR